MSDVKFMFVLVCLVITSTILGYQVRANSNTAKEVEHQAEVIANATRIECEDVNNLKVITTRALQSAIQRAKAALPDPQARASIIVLEDQIRSLDTLRDCTP